MEQTAGRAPHLEVHRPPRRRPLWSMAALPERTSPLTARCLPTPSQHAINGIKNGLQGQQKIDEPMFYAAGKEFVDGANKMHAGCHHDDAVLVQNGGERGRCGMQMRGALKATGR